MRRATCYIFLSCLCCSLIAQSRNPVDHDLRDRDFHPDRDFFQLGIGSSSHFAPGLSPLVLSDSGIAVISHYQPSLSFGGLIDIPFPTFSNSEADFSMQAVSPAGEQLWQYDFQENLVWAGMVTLVDDHIYFVVHPDRHFILPPGTDEGIRPPDLPANIVVCLSLNTGEELWRNEVSGFVSALKPANGGNIYVMYSQVLGIGNAEKLAAFDANGQSLWDLELRRDTAGEDLPD